jgi:hypothetical protein
VNSRGPAGWGRILSIVLLSVSCLAFGVALAAPIFSIEPGAGELTPWLRALKPEAMAQISQSLWGGIEILWKEGDLALAFLLGLFCLVLPFFKFVVMWSGVLRAGMESSRWGKAVAATAKYSMVEILILAILALVVKGLPGGSSMNFEPAAWFFAASILLSLLAVEISRTRTSRGSGEKIARWSGA